jgi:predicted MFS family arabinose efflux permease
VPETEEWSTAKERAHRQEPTIRDLFRGRARRTTFLVIAACALGLSGHWAFMFWNQIHFKNLPDIIGLTDQAKGDWGRRVLYLTIVASILGNFVAAWLARHFGYRRVIAVMSVGYFLGMMACYIVERPALQLYYWLAVPGFFQGLFALYTMYLPPLFPTLLRTTGAGFCYNIGRTASAVGVVFFGLFSQVGDYRVTLIIAGTLFLPAAVVACFLPELEE